MPERASLDGKSVIVTGGGTGIGAACAKKLAVEGASVTICGRTEARLVDVAAAIRAVGGSVAYKVTDVTREDDVAALVQAHVDEFGSLTGVVANAGGGGGMGPYHLLDTDEFVRVLHLNVLGTMLCVKHAVPELAKTRGSFVGMSSLAGHVTHPWFGAYTVAKAGIEAMMRNAADEYGPVGVRFNSVRPGFIATEIMELIPRDSAVFASYIENTPLGDIGQPEDVADLVRFLVSDESRWITGQEIGIDGGNGLRRGPDFTEFVEPMVGSAGLRPSVDG
jgi:NAD(P)-dependent dehydrogenase (short-subunit alcohol dehydrogenase family)